MMAVLRTVRRHPRRRLVLRGSGYAIVRNEEGHPRAMLAWHPADAVDRLVAGDFLDAHDRSLTEKGRKALTRANGDLIEGDAE